MVPCLYDKPLLAEGIGEKITTIETNFTYPILLIKPDFSCSTKEMYGKIDEEELFSKNDCAKLIKEALQRKEIDLLIQNLYNTFEKVIPYQKEVEKIKKELIQTGAKGVLMTGSGSCVYGIYENKEEAEKAYTQLKDNYQVYQCTAFCGEEGGLSLD